MHENPPCSPLQRLLSIGNVHVGTLGRPAFVLGGAPADLLAGQREIPAVVRLNTCSAPEGRGVRARRLSESGSSGSRKGGPVLSPQLPAATRSLNEPQLSAVQPHYGAEGIVLLHFSGPSAFLVLNSPIIRPRRFLQRQ